MGGKAPDRHQDGHADGQMDKINLGECKCDVSSSDEIISFLHMDRHTHTQAKTYTSSLRRL